MLPAFLTTILFALSGVSGKRVTNFMGGTEANFWRLTMAAALLALYAHNLGTRPGGTGFELLFISGCIGFGMGDLALFQAYPRIGSRLTLLLVHCLASPFAAVTEWLWLEHRLTGAEMLCGLIILGGVLLALAPGQHLEVTRRKLWTGVVFALLAAYGQGFGAVLSRKAYGVIDAAGGHIDGISAAYHRMLGGLLVSGIFVLLVKRHEIVGNFIRERTELAPGVPVHPDRWRKGWFWLVINGLAGPALGVSCYQWALLSKGTGVVLPIVAITPLVVVPMSRILEGERPSKRSLVGGFIAVVGAVMLALVSR